MTGTVKLHRILKGKTDRVYRAFLEAEALAKWLPPYGFTCTVQHMEAKVGGTFRMSFRNFTTGNGHSFGGEYIALVPNEKVAYTDRFDDPKMKGTMTTTITLRALPPNLGGGTELTVVQEGIPDMIPVEMCYMGWQESLEQLAKLVDPEIPDAGPA